jgi:hypothetical protein
MVARLCHGLPMVRQPIPLRLDRDHMSRAAFASIARNIVSRAECALLDQRLSVTQSLSQRGWDDDRVAELLTRATTSPAKTSQSGWAAELAHVGQAFLRSLAPASAAAQLLESCLSVSLDGRASIGLPNIAPGAAHFVQQGEPIRVAQMPTTPGSTLAAAKMATIVLLTAELLASSNVESIVKQALLDSLAPSLDAALFDNSAAVPDLRPAGLLFGVTPIAASTSTPKTDAMQDDISALVAAIAAYAGNSSVALVAAPKQATRLLLSAQRLPGLVLMSNALPAGRVIALATRALVAAVETPTIDTAKASSFHMDSTSPQPIPAAPTSEVFQIDCIALRLRLPVTWALRASGAVAYVDATG